MSSVNAGSENQPDGSACHAMQVLRPKLSPKALRKLVKECESLVGRRYDIIRVYTLILRCAHFCVWFVYLEEWRGVCGILNTLEQCKFPACGREVREEKCDLSSYDEC